MLPYLVLEIFSWRHGCHQQEMAYYQQRSIIKLCDSHQVFILRNPRAFLSLDTKFIIKILRCVHNTIIWSAVAEN